MFICGYKSHRDRKAGCHLPGPGKSSVVWVPLASESAHTRWPYSQQQDVRAMACLEHGVAGPSRTSSAADGRVVQSQDSPAACEAAGSSAEKFLYTEGKRSQVLLAPAQMMHRLQKPRLPSRDTAQAKYLGQEPTQGFSLEGLFPVRASLRPTRSIVGIACAPNLLSLSQSLRAYSKW